MKMELNKYHKLTNSIFDEIGGIMEQAELIAGGVFKSVQEIAGTTVCKGVQIEQLAKC